MNYAERNGMDYRVAPENILRGEELEAVIKMAYDPTTSKRNFDIIFEDQIWPSLLAFAKSMLKSKYPTYYNNPEHRESMLIAAAAEIHVLLKRYDGRSAVTTFLKPYILAAYRTYISELQNKSDSEALTDSKVLKAKRQIEMEGKEPTIALLSEITGKSAYVISNSLKRIINDCMDSYEANITFYDTMVAEDDIEKTILQEEESQKLREYLNELTDIERRVILLTTGYEDGIPRELTKIAKEMDIPVNKIRSIDKTARKKLKKIITTDGFFDVRTSGIGKNIAEINAELHFIPKISEEDRENVKDLMLDIDINFFL